MSLFERPHRCFSSFDVVMELKPEALPGVVDYGVWVEKVEAELVAVYGTQVAHLALADIFYATRDAPTTFASRISEELFERLRAYKTILQQPDDVSAQLAHQTKQHSWRRCSWRLRRLLGTRCASPSAICVQRMHDWRSCGGRRATSSTSETVLARSCATSSRRRM